MILRHVEVYKDGVWREMKFSSIRKGDVFRLFEDDAREVRDPQGNTTFIALKDANPYDNPDGNNIVSCYGVCDATWGR